MIGIFFRPDKTQIIRAKIRGDKKLFVKEAKEFGSCYEIFKQTEEKEIFEVFQELKKNLKFGNEDVYLVMPDELFEMTDVANITSEEEKRRFVENSTGLNFGEVYVSTPIVATPGTHNKKQFMR